MLRLVAAWFPCTLHLQLWVEGSCRWLEPLTEWFQAVEPFTQNPQLLLLFPVKIVPALLRQVGVTLRLLRCTVQGVVLEPQPHLFNQLIGTLPASFVGGQLVSGIHHRQLTSWVGHQLVHQGTLLEGGPGPLGDRSDRRLHLAVINGSTEDLTLQPFPGCNIHATGFEVRQGNQNLIAISIKDLAHARHVQVGWHIQQRGISANGVGGQPQNTLFHHWRLWRQVAIAPLAQFHQRIDDVPFLGLPDPPACSGLHQGRHLGTGIRHGQPPEQVTVPTLQCSAVVIRGLIAVLAAAAHHLPQRWQLWLIRQIQSQLTGGVEGQLITH